MAIKRHWRGVPPLVRGTPWNPEEIVTKLRQVEVLVGRGMAQVDAIREIRLIHKSAKALAGSTKVCGVALTDDLALDPKAAMLTHER